MGGTKQINRRQSGLPRDTLLRLRCFVRVSIACLAVALYQVPDPAEGVTFAYVTNAGSGNVSVINATTHSVATTITVGLTPEQIAITPNGAFAYVANFVSNTVSVIATASNTVVATVPVGANPTGVAITPSDIPIIPTLSDGALLFLFAAMAAALAMRICARPVSRPRHPPHAI